MYNPENLEILKILVQTIVRCNLTYSFSATHTLSRDREVARTEECPNKICNKDFIIIKNRVCGKTKSRQFIAPSRANHAPQKFARTHFPVCSRAIHCASYIHLTCL